MRKPSQFANACTPAMTVTVSTGGNSEASSSHFAST
jgi:hypothetical protein